MDMPELDRLEHALFDTLDPSKEHLTSFLAGAGASAPAEAGSDPEQSKVTSASVTGDWSEGDRAGNVSLSVEDPTAGEWGLSDPGAAPCEDPGLFSGPQLSCERRELADGTVVLVGTGSKNGFARITVHYVRPDGQLVWATSDQASGHLVGGQLRCGSARRPAGDSRPADRLGPGPPRSPLTLQPRAISLG